MVDDDTVKEFARHMMVSMESGYGDDLKISGKDFRLSLCRDIFAHCKFVGMARIGRINIQTAITISFGHTIPDDARERVEWNASPLHPSNFD
jgi:hypothetical protein